jgi:hypothetical protein
MTDPKELVRQFLSGTGVDHLGRSRDQMLSWSDDELEFTHDYIQWLFPLETASQYHPGAPVPTVADFAELGKDSMVYIGLLSGFVRMLSFYGLEWSDQAVVKSHNWEERCDEWAWRPGHNDLRITRILHALAHGRVSAKSSAPSIVRLLARCSHPAVSALKVLQKN